MPSSQPKNNAVGLRLLSHPAFYPRNTVRSVFNTIFDEMRRQSVSVVVSGPLSRQTNRYRVYRLKAGENIGWQELHRVMPPSDALTTAIVAPNHLEILSIDGLHTDEPSILLKVHNQRAQNIVARIYPRLLVNGGENLDDPNFINFATPPLTLRADSGSARVVIGDTLELNSRNGHGDSAYFSVIGLSVADDTTISNLVSHSCQANISLKLLPFVASWFDIRHKYLTTQFSIIWETEVRENSRKKLDIIYLLLRQNPPTIARSVKVHKVEQTKAVRTNAMSESKVAAPETPRVSDSLIIQLADGFFLTADKDNIRVSDINRSIAREFGLVKFDGRRKNMIKERWVGLMRGSICVGDPVRKKRKTKRRNNRNVSWDAVRNLRRRVVHAEAIARHAYFNNLLLPVHAAETPNQRYTQPAHGLRNPGNLCYMNTVVQLLYGMRCTRELFFGGSLWSRIDASSFENFLAFGKKGGFIAIALHRMFRKMQSPNYAPIVTEFRDALVTNERFRDFDNDQQHDANELLTRLLDTLSDALRSEEGDPNAGDPISHWFRSRVISWIRCQTCHHESLNADDKSTSLDIPVTGNNIHSCLSAYFAEEEVSWNCSECNCKRSAKKGFRLEPRHILIVSLKRYDDRGRKVDARVGFPLDNLDTSPYSNTQAPTHRLVAVINHYQDQSLLGGHYDLFMRIGEGWSRFDDVDVSSIEADEVVTNSAYTLVYCRRDRYDWVTR
jgi:ubiquitin C-terminal hydrolase